MLRLFDERLKIAARTERGAGVAVEPAETFSRRFTRVTMSNIPNSAMPHAYADEEDGRGEHLSEEAETAISTGLMIAGAALAGYLLMKLLR